MRVLARLDVPSPKNGNGKEDAKDAEEEKLETLRSDKSQATIANFLRNKKEA
jgi:hypothetical protein